jgi:O-methyltransferase
VAIDADTERQDVARLRDLYLELLIGGLTHTIYPRVDQMELPEELVERLTPGMREAEDKWMIFHPELARAQGRDWPLYAQTMIGLERMRSVRRCVETVLRDDVPGDLIEAGVWRGGVGILMRGILKAYGVDDRQVWVADSFRGLPPPDPDRDRGVESHELEWLAVPLEEVRENFDRYGLLDERVRFVEGWFRDTLPALRDVRWSVVRIDSDLYESTMDALVNLYDGLSPGGFLIIDDFFLDACREAVEDFRRDRGIEDPIERIDWTGVYWRKRSQ